MSIDEIPNIQSWIQSLAIIAGMLVASALIRLALRTLGKKPRWSFLIQLAPSVSNIIYIVGLKLFTEVAPLHPRIAAWLEGGVYILAVLILLSVLRRVALVAVEWGAARAQANGTNGYVSSAMQHGFIPLMRNVITLFVVFSGGIMILKHFNYDVMSLLTALGVGSLAVGLAAKETLANMISGFTLIIDRNLRPGDRINLGGLIGDVKEIGLRSTTIQMIDGNMLIVPNAELVNTKILNLSLPSRDQSCSATIRVSFATPFEKIRAICLDVLESVEKARKDRPRSVSLSSLSEGHQAVTIGFWVKDIEYVGGAVSDFNEKLLERMKREKIPLLHPSQT